MEISYTRYFNAPAVVKKAVDTANLNLAIRVSNQAKALAPFDLGQLRNSIMWRTPSAEGGFNDDGSGAKGEKRISARPRSGDAYVGINLDYAVYQEFGTRKMRPQPYLRPAIAIEVYNRGPRDVAEDIRKEVELGALGGGKTRVRFY